MAPSAALWRPAQPDGCGRYSHGTPLGRGRGGWPSGGQIHMKCTTWNTSDVEPAWQFDYYRSGICESFAHLTPHKPLENDRFSARVEHWVSGDTEFTFLGTSTHRVSRSRKDIAKVGDDNFYLNFIQRGEMHLDQFDTRQLLRAGDLTVIDNAHRFEAEIDASGGHRHLAFRIDRRKFPVGALELTYRLKSHQLAPALRHALLYLCRVDASWDSHHLANVTAAVEGLITIIASTDASFASPSRAYTTLRSVQKLVSASFADPEFSLDEVADRLRMPRRSLQKTSATLRLQLFHHVARGKACTGASDAHAIGGKHVHRRSLLPLRVQRSFHVLPCVQEPLWHAAGSTAGPAGRSDGLR